MTPSRALALLVLIASAAVISLSLANGPERASGGTAITVDTTEDPSALAGNCSLREAIEAANTNTSVDNCDGTVSNTIVFDLGSGTPVINIAGELQEITAPVTILGDTGGATRVELRGPGGSGTEIGLLIGATAPGTVIRKLVVNSFPNAGIFIYAANVTVTGSFIGTNADGTIAMFNYYGIDASNASGVHIGGTNGVTPGGPCTGDCNLISGNEDGVYLSTDAVLEGNFIGTNAAGTSALPNVSGVRANAGQANAVVGGTAPGAGNLISGNTEYGIFSHQALTIQGNRIGTNAAGTGAIPNGPVDATFGAITLDGANSGFLSDATLIGGTTAASRNIISGNNGSGIVIRDGATDVSVQGNRIGTTADGQGTLGNLSMGVHIFDASANSIGGVGQGQGNVIAFNHRGVRVDGGGGNTNANAIRGNSIHSNTFEGINNVDGGNNDLAPPVITGAGSAFGTACPNCEVDVFSDSEDEGRIYEGTTTADAGGDWTFSGALSGPFITATATDAMNNTSMFSAPFELPATPTPSPTPSPSPTPTPTSTSIESDTPTPEPTETGAPTVTATPDPSETPAGQDAIWGDNNCSGPPPNPVDALLALRHDAGLSTNTGACPAMGTQVDVVIAVLRLWGDIDCSDAVDPVDALKLLRFDAGLSVSQAVGCPGIGAEVSLFADQA